MQPAPAVLFVSHTQQQCGVYQFGRNVAETLRRSARYRFLYQECAGEDELLAAVAREQPVAIIYNYHPWTQHWLTDKITGPKLSLPQIGIFHEVTQAIADAADTRLFDYHIAPDPSLELRNPRMFKTGRLLPDYTNKFSPPETLTVGCFGFGTAGKRFDRVITYVQREFDQAIIRLHLPFSTFADPDGQQAKAVAEECRQMIVKPGIELRVSHDFLTPEQLLDFLAANTINCFFYEQQQEGRGISSVLDFALAAQRPVAISRCAMFRHLNDAQPSICIDDFSLREILAHGFTPLEPYLKAWSAANLIRDYENIVTQILEHPLPRPRWRGTLPSKIKRKLDRVAYHIAHRSLPESLKFASR